MRRSRALLFTVFYLASIVLAIVATVLVEQQQHRLIMANAALPVATAALTPVVYRHRSYPSVLVVGDSISGSSGATTPEQGYARQVISALQQQDPRNATAWTLVGEAGMDTGQVYERLHIIHGQFASSSSLIIVELGTNDWHHNHALTQFRATYQQMLGMLLANSPHAQLLCLSGWPNYGRQNTLGLTMDPYSHVIQAECQDAHGSYVNIAPLHSAQTVANNASNDNYHPNDYGHTLIARAVLAAIPTK